MIEGEIYEYILYGHDIAIQLIYPGYANKQIVFKNARVSIAVNKSRVLLKVWIWIGGTGEVNY